uniref:serine hydrolase n=1 Tax=uncultured Amaricoccus sp. TaxID=339341 RepID=UPI002611CABB
MPDPQSVLDAAVARGDLPFAVGLVGGPEGPLWQGAAGEAAPGVPAGPDTVYQLYSMTKAVGAVAAAILVERGR